KGTTVETVNVAVEEINVLPFLRLLCQQILENGDFTFIEPAGLSTGHRIDDGNMSHDEKIFRIVFFELLQKPWPLLRLGIPQTAGTGRIDNEKIGISVFETVKCVAEKFSIIVKTIGTGNFVIGRYRVP